MRTGIDPATRLPYQETYSLVKPCGFCGVFNCIHDANALLEQRLRSETERAESVPSWKTWMVEVAREAREQR